MSAMTWNGGGSNGDWNDSAKWSTIEDEYMKLEKVKDVNGNQINKGDTVAIATTDNGCAKMTMGDVLEIDIKKQKIRINMISETHQRWGFNSKRKNRNYYIGSCDRMVVIKSVKSKKIEEILK